MTATTGVRPCVYPRCADVDGNPTLTDQGMCPACRRAYRQLLHRLVDDYAALHAQLGQLTAAPESGCGGRTAVSYGHPGEHLSDAKRRISGALDGAEDGLRDYLGDTPANPARRESRTVATASRYLAGHLEQLATYPGARDTAADLADAHHASRWALGWRPAAQHLPTPCPECELLTLARIVRWDRSDTISCSNCGAQISSESYGLWTRIVAGQLADTRNTNTSS